MSNLAQTSHDAFHAADRAGGLETVLRFMRSQPAGFKCTRYDIHVATGLPEKTVTARVHQAIADGVLAEDGSVRDGKKLVSLNNGAKLSGLPSRVAPLNLASDSETSKRSVCVGESQSNASDYGVTRGSPSVQERYRRDSNQQPSPTPSAASRNTVRAPSPLTSLGGHQISAGDSAISTPESTALAPAAFSNHGQAESVTVAGAVDTSSIGDYSEDFRHRCEVRAVANMPDREYRKHYLAGVRRKRGDAAVERIKNDLKAMVPA